MWNLKLAPTALAGLLLASCAANVAPSMHVAVSREPAPGQPVELAIRLKDGVGRPIERLEVVHEKPLHFLVMSSDLSFFAHEHPEPRPDGALRLDFTFPAAGEYVLFGDYTPVGGRGTISSTRLAVPGAAPKPAVLVKDDLSKSRRSGDYEVRLDLVDHGEQSMLTFKVTKDGRPVADLRPYLGALGHLVLVDPGATKLLHSHPFDPGEPGQVAFHTAFPAPGLYKLWAEFRPEGKPLRVEFVVEI